MNITRQVAAPVDDALALGVTTSLATTGAFDYEEYAGGRLLIPSGSSITALTFYEMINRSDGQAAAVQCFDGAATPAAVSLAVGAGQSYPIPDALYGCNRIIVVGDAAGTIYVKRKS